MWDSKGEQEHRGVSRHMEKYFFEWLDRAKCFGVGPHDIASPNCDMNSNSGGM